MRAETDFTILGGGPAGLAVGFYAQTAGLNFRIYEAQNRVGRFLNQGSEPLQRERDLQLPGPHGAIPLRLYLPDAGPVRPPLLIYFHGGGFAHGTLDSWDATLRRIVRGSGAAVLSVDYRLAPEHRFPVAFDEAVSVVRQVLSGRAVRKSATTCTNRR